MRATLLAACLLVSASLPASADNLFMRNFWLDNKEYDAEIPACDSAEVQQTITKRFMQMEVTYWQSMDRLGAFSHVRETAFRPWGERFIPRRFCSAKVDINTGKTRSIHYVILEDQGFGGVGWGVEWCVSGYDKHFAYAPGCKMMQP